MKFLRFVQLYSELEWSMNSTIEQKLVSIYYVWETSNESIT